MLFHVYPIQCYNKLRVPVFVLDHETISIPCHVGLHVGLFIHSNFVGPVGPQVLVLKVTEP